MKKKTKVNKKRLDSLLLILLLTAVLMIMSTYAWFTANRTVEIGTINVQVETSSGLLISANGKHWSTKLEVDEIRQASSSDSEYGNYRTARNQLPVELSPVSTVLERNGNSIRMFLGTVNQETDRSSDYRGQYFLTTTEETESDGATGRFIAFDIFLKSGNPEPNLYMSGNVIEVDKDYNEITNIANEKGIANAARVALIRGGTTEDVDTQSSVTGLNTDGEIMMWEPNYDYHTSEGVDNAENVYGITTLHENGGNSYVKYDGVATAIPNTNRVLLSDAKDDGTGSKFKEVQYQWASKKKEAVNLELPKITVGDEQYGILKGATKYRVYMWIEGQDVDCENNASGTYLQFSLNFSLDEDGDATTLNESRKISE